MRLTRLAGLVQPAPVGILGRLAQGVRFLRGWRAHLSQVLVHAARNVQCLLQHGHEPLVRRVGHAAVARRVLIRNLRRCCLRRRLALVAKNRSVLFLCDATGGDVVRLLRVQVCG